MVLKDVGEPMFKERVLEPLHCGGYIVLGFAAHPVKCEAGRDFFNVDRGEHP
jgi:hypothetical protein